MTSKRGPTAQAEMDALAMSLAHTEGLRGSPPPSFDKPQEYLLWAQGDAQRRQEAEHREMKQAAPCTPDTSNLVRTPRSPPSPPQVRILTSEESEMLHNDGHYGVPLSIDILDHAEQSAYRQAIASFITAYIRHSVSFKRNGHYSQYEAIVQGVIYAPLNEFRTYHPLAAMKFGFDGGSVSPGSKVSVGAAWCIQRGREFGDAHRKYTQDLQACHLERERRERLNWMSRKLLERSDPIQWPAAGANVCHAERFLLIHDRLLQSSASMPATASALEETIRFDFEIPRTT